MAESMLSTIDNPYDPFEQFDDWYAWDERSGYHTTSYLARIVKNSDDISETDQDIAVEQAIDEIIKENISGVYIRVTRKNSNA